jgi:hypothetical protein
MAQIEVFGDKELIKLLNETRITVEKAWSKMTSAASKEVIKRAKMNASQFKTHDNTYTNPDTLKRSPLPIRKSFKQWTSKKKKLTSYVRAMGLAANVQEYGASIVAKKSKYLRFKVDGKWRVAESVSIPARPYLSPAYSEIYETEKGREIMETELKKVIEDWWNKGK